ncbi:hypothetical protein ACFQV4_14205 [Streptomyces thermocarboxydus]
MVLAGTAACGTVENLTAGQKLDNAFEKLGEERSIAFELDLDTDAKSLMALDAEQSEPGEEMPAEMAELLSEGTISVSMYSKKPIKESEDKDFTAMTMKLSGPDGALLEYRLVGDWIYARVDAATLGEMSGNPMPSVKELPPQAGRSRSSSKASGSSSPRRRWRRPARTCPGRKASEPRSPRPSPASTPRRRRS